MFPEKKDEEVNEPKVPLEIKESGQSSGFVQQSEQYVGVALPRSLWPHNFLIFSLIMTIVFGLLNQVTLVLTIPATILAFLVSRH